MKMDLYNLFIPKWMLLSEYWSNRPVGTLTRNIHSRKYFVLVNESNCLRFQLQSRLPKNTWPRVIAPRCSAIFGKPLTNLAPGLGVPPLSTEAPKGCEKDKTTLTPFSPIAPALLSSTTKPEGCPLACKICAEPIPASALYFQIFQQSVCGRCLVVYTATAESPRVITGCCLPQAPVKPLLRVRYARNVITWMRLMIQTCSHKISGCANRLR